MANGGEGGSQAQAIMAIVLVARQEGILDDAPQKDAQPRKPQVLKWDLPSEIVYGTPLNALPEVQVVEGNRDAVPVYAPPRNERLIGQGDHFLSVSIPGNDEFEPAELRMPVRVRGAPLVVTVPRDLMMPVGGPLPEIEAEVKGAAVGTDRFHIEYNCAAQANSPRNMAGFPITPVVVFDQGLVTNYDLTLNTGLLKVHASEMDMLKEFSGFRERIKRLPKERQRVLEEFIDLIGQHRKTEDHAKLALAQHQLAIDLDELEYFKVTDIIFAPHAPRIEINEEVRITATVQPEEATQPALVWSVDKPELATLSDGLLKRAGKDGGEVRVTATSQCRDGIIKSTTVYLRPLPQQVVVDGPLHVFLDESVQMRAHVLPPEADQRVTWKRVGQWKKNCSLTGGGMLQVAAPSAKGGSHSGQMWLQAISEVDQELRSDETEVTFGGKRTSSVYVKPAKSLIKLGERLTLTAVVQPSEAEQQVDWIVDDQSVAQLENIKELSADVVMVRAGTVSVRAVATDGTGQEGQAQVGVKVDLQKFDVTCDKTDIGIVDTLKLTPVFTPPEGACRLSWQLAKKSAPAMVDKEVLHPGGVGLVTLTVSVPETAFSKTLNITVTANDGMSVTAIQWLQIKQLVENYAKRIKIDKNPGCQQKYTGWLYDLSEKIIKNGETPTLQQLKDEMIGLRDLHYRWAHWQWLEEAGFTSGGNCYIRSDTTMTHANTDYRVHMTMFPTDGAIEVGPRNKYQELENKIYRVNVSGFKSMHATLYVRPVGKQDQCKVYASGEDWTPPWSVKAYLGGEQAYQNLVAALRAWMLTKKTKAETALRKVFDDVHEHDNDKIA